MSYDDWLTTPPPMESAEDEDDEPEHCECWWNPETGYFEACCRKHEDEFNRDKEH